MAPAPMPNRYIVEMLMDRIAASKVYKKDAYTNRSPLEYYLLGKEPAPMHEKTKECWKSFFTCWQKKAKKGLLHI